MELINKEELLKFSPDFGKIKTIKDGMLQYAKAIKDAPAVDAVMVVRCKECYCADNETTPEGLIWCNYCHKAMLEYDFCSHGERRNYDG